MHTRSSAALTAALWVTAAAAAGPPMIEAQRGAIDRAIDPANFSGCLWTAEYCDHQSPVPRAGITGTSTTLISNGPSSNRIDLVIVGDGYTATELTTYASHAQRGVDDLFSTSPFNTYHELFNVHRVNVISNESGVDNDPTQGISRDTALGMSFWCGGTERLLCVGTGLANSAAQNAPDVDQVFAVANSTKYGGAGYPSSNVGTYSGGNSSAPQIAIHELGHSLGNLADEYAYGGPAVYSGAEPTARNVSIYNAAEQSAHDIKWSHWLGVNATDFDGLVSAYEGGQYSSQGIYRPSSNSMMRSLGREFNLPSVEALIIEMWKIVSPIDAHSSNQHPVTRFDTLEVHPAKSFLTISWYLGDDYVGGGPTLNLSAVNLPASASTLSVTVTDNTPLVRDEAARQLYMKQRVTWTIEALAADLSADGSVNAADLAILLAAWGTTAADLTNDGTTSAADLAILLASWG